MKDSGLPLYRSRPKRRIDWRNWIIFVAAIVLLVAAMTLIWGNAEGASKDPCRSERAAWRKAQHALVIGDQRPATYWTAQYALLQCQREHRER